MCRNRATDGAEYPPFPKPPPTFAVAMSYYATAGDVAKDTSGFVRSRLRGSLERDDGVARCVTKTQQSGETEKSEPAKIEPSRVLGSGFGGVACYTVSSTAARRSRGGSRAGHRSWLCRWRQGLGAVLRTRTATARSSCHVERNRDDDECENDDCDSTAHNQSPVPTCTGGCKIKTRIYRTGALGFMARS